MTFNLASKHIEATHTWQRARQVGKTEHFRPGQKANWGPLREPLWNSVASKWQVSITYTVHWLGSICHGSPGREVSTPTMVAAPRRVRGIENTLRKKKQSYNK